MKYAIVRSISYSVNCPEVVLILDRGASQWLENTMTNPPKHMPHNTVEHNQMGDFTQWMYFSNGARAIVLGSKTDAHEFAKLYLPKHAEFWHIKVPAKSAEWERKPLAK